MEAKSIMEQMENDANKATDIQSVLEALIAGHGDLIGELRKVNLLRAIELGASRKALESLRDANRTSQKKTIVLPCHRFENLSRGKGWARKGKSSSAEWGEREGSGYRVGPGKWTVGGNDGYTRKGETQWDVEHVSVGGETWTIAN